MPATTSNRTPTLGPIRLTKADHARFAELVARDGKSQTQVLREAVLFYLDHRDEQRELKDHSERDKLIVESLKRMENRFAGLMVRLGIDIEQLWAYLWLTAPKDQREKIFEKCYKVGQGRFRRKLEGLDAEMKQALKKQSDNLG